MQSDELKRRISAGRGDALADLVLKNAKIVNVFTDEIDTADIAISGNSIVGVGTYHGRKEVDLHGKYVCPGLIDGHIHIESSMLCGPAFEQAVLPHGTTAVVTDPHEISNVAGLEGLDFMLETTKNLTLSVYFMLPSCVPATDLDESGAVLNAEQLRPYYGDPRVLGLAELMNAYGTVRCLSRSDRWTYPHRKLHALWSGFRAGSAAPRYHCGGHRPTRDLERCGAGRLGFYAGNDKKSDPFGLFHAALLCSGHGSG